LFKKNKILYKVEGSSKIGMGHVFRSFYLIQNLKKKYDIIIFTKKKSESEIFFKSKNFRVITHNQKNEFKKFKKIYRDYKIDKFINDTITINQKIYNFLPKLKKKCFFLDTEQVRASKINHCINTFLSTKQKHKNHYYGLKYVITDPRLKISKKKYLHKKQKILLHFGGSDEKMFNLKIINILSSFNKKIKLSVILGPALNYKLNVIYKLLKRLKFDFRIYNYPKNLNSIYNDTSIAIISGGNTLYNFCYLRKKNISISMNKYETNNCKRLSKYNLTYYYGHYNKINKKRFIHYFKKIVNLNSKKKKILKIDGVRKISNIIN